MSSDKKDTGRGISRRAFVKTSGIALGATAIGGLTFVPRTFAKSGPIKLGFPVPLTGPYGTEAKDQAAGAALAIAEINKKGGVLGRKVELVVRDTQLKPEIATQMAKELVDSVRVELMSGCLSAANQLAVNQVCKAAGIPYMSVSQSNEITERQDDSVMTWHEAMNPYMTTQAVGEYVGKHFGKRWYFLTADYAYGWQMTDGFRTKGKEYGITDVGEIKAPLGTSDFSPYMPRIMAAKPDVLFLDNFGKDQLNSIKQATDFGLKSKIKLVCPIIILSERMAAGWKAYEGVIGGTSFYWEQDHPSSKRFVEAYRKANGRPPIDYAGYAYSGIRELLTGINQAGSLDVLKLAETLEGKTYDTYKGDEWWRPCDHQAQQDVFIVESKQATGRDKYAVFKFIATISGANQRLLKSCVAEGLNPDKPIRAGLKTTAGAK